MEIPINDFIDQQPGAWKEIVTEMIEAPLIHALNGNSFNGPGSSLLYTEELRIALPRIFRRYQVVTMIDAPCGDLTWIRHTDLTRLYRYIGIDIDERIIENNKNIMHQNKVFEFLCSNILTLDGLPRVDLILCRDFFAHLTNEAIELAIKRFRDSGSKYLLASNYIGSNNSFTYRPEDYPWKGYMERTYSLTDPPFGLSRIDGIPEDSPPDGVISHSHELALFELNS